MDQAALTFLVISCPCALVISVPLTFFGGVGGASRRGVLIKGANYLEQLAKTDIAVFDKTGTLTRGTFEVTAIHPNQITEEELLELAALAESYSDPIPSLRRFVPHGTVRWTKAVSPMCRKLPAEVSMPWWTAGRYMRGMSA